MLKCVNKYFTFGIQYEYVINIVIIFFEIRGGVTVRDRKAKVLTVTFSEEMATGWEYSENAGPAQFDIPLVSFVLTRISDLSYCEE